MKKNMSTADRTIRMVVALAIVVLYLTGAVGGTLAIVLGVIAVAFIVTSLVGWCPTYWPFKLSTRKEPPGSTPA